MMDTSILFELAPQLRVLSLDLYVDEDLESPPAEDAPPWRWDSLVAFDNGAAFNKDLEEVFADMGSSCPPPHVRFARSWISILYGLKKFFGPDGELEEWAEGVEKLWLEVNDPERREPAYEGMWEETLGRLRKAGIEVVEGELRDADPYLAFQDWVDEVERIEAEEEGSEL